LVRPTTQAPVAIRVTSQLDQLGLIPIVKRTDEVAFGVCRTKWLILEVYNAMGGGGADTGALPDELDPPPADPLAAHPASTRPDWVDLLLPSGEG
jgi:hypothetical protein